MCELLKVPNEFVKLEKRTLVENLKETIESLENKANVRKWNSFTVLKRNAITITWMLANEGDFFLY